MDLHRISRRKLLFNAGAGVLGVTVLNTVAACSSDDKPPASTPSSGSSAPPAAGGGLGDWKRVDMTQVSAYLLVRGNETAVVDLGLTGSEAAIETGLKAAGSSWANVKHVILTHKHPDHAGGLDGVQPKVKASWYAGEADVASIISETSLKPLKDGDEVFGLRIISTPGHTAGHICVFDPSNGVLVAGDALTTSNGLTGSNPQFTEDEKQAATSVKKLATLGVRAILPGHGAPLETGAAEALSRLAATL